MAKGDRQAGGKTPARTRKKTSIVIDEDLLHRLKFAALEERTDVSALLGRLVEEYLRRRKGAR
jgi:hypothetical protein